MVRTLTNKIKKKIGMENNNENSENENNMNPPNITNATIMPKLHGILTEDIAVLDDMLTNRTKASKSYRFIESLKEAKIKILNMLPGDVDGIGSVPTPPQKLRPTSYEKTNKTEIRDNVQLAKTFYELEQSQLTYVTQSAGNKGIPKDVQILLEKIVKIYSQITDQLHRSSKTHQLNEIVV